MIDLLVILNRKTNHIHGEGFLQLPNTKQMLDLMKSIEEKEEEKERKKEGKKEQYMSKCNEDGRYFIPIVVGIRIVECI